MSTSDFQGIKACLYVSAIDSACLLVGDDEHMSTSNFQGIKACLPLIPNDHR